MLEKLKTKTFKREYSAILVGLLCYLVYVDNIAMMTIVVWPFLSFVATSVGAHIYDRTTSNRREIIEVQE